VKEDDLTNILIVEDSLTQAMRLKFILEGHGYKVTTAENGMQALELLDGAGIQTVITDWIMPEMDGVEFCKAVRKKKIPGYIFIILVTAKDSLEDLITGLDAGADDYLIKPIRPGELLARLKTAKRVITLERSLRKRTEEVALLSITDPLTHVYNRRYLNDHLPREINRSLRYGHHLSITMCDIDHFKRVNDTYGHQAGDRVLESFAGCLKETTRDGLDWISRYGGEEFVVVMPETELDGATLATERYRLMISAKQISTSAGIVHITASFGVTSLDPSAGMSHMSAERMLEVADQCLYQAKEGGRNRCVARPLEKEIRPVRSRR